METSNMKSTNAKPETHPRRTKAVGKAQKDLSAGAKILAAINEATEILRSEGLESKQLTVRTYKEPPAQLAYQPEDVKRVRELVGVSQAALAGFLGVNVNTVRSWEQGKRLPQPIACRFLAEIEANLVYWRTRIGHQVLETEPGKRLSPDSDSFLD
jgi:putative transcriptional regulator